MHCYSDKKSEIFDRKGNKLLRSNFNKYHTYSISKNQAINLLLFNEKRKKQYPFDRAEIKWGGKVVLMLIPY